MTSFFLAVALLAPLDAETQSVKQSDRALAPVPFGLGERMTYRVRLGGAGEIGNGAIEVLGMDTVRGFETYQLRLAVKGRVAFFKLENEYKSWLDVHSLISHRFISDVDEVRYERKRTLEFYPDEKRWFYVETKREGEMPTDEPLDDISFLFYARTMPLEVGQTYTLQRYWKDEGNPVTLKVLRKDTISNGLGTFATIVVQPIVRTDGLFREGGEAEVHFTDDARRIPILIKTKLPKVPLINSLTMELSRYEPGERISPPWFPRPGGQ